jgi:hypothetical protein
MRRTLPSLRLALPGLAAVALASASPSPAGAQFIPFGPSLEAAGWSSFSFTMLNRPRFTPDGGGSLIVETAKAAGLLWKPLAEEARGAARAAWRWRADAAVPPTDLTRKGADDRVLSVYFLFGEASDVGKGAMSAMRSATTRALVYVYGGDRARGTVLPSPHMGARGRFIVLRRADAPTGQWFSESVDLGKDYARVFGKPAPLLIGVALSSDSDDTGTSNRVEIGGLSLSK